MWCNSKFCRILSWYDNLYRFCTRIAWAQFSYKIVLSSNTNAFIRIQSFLSCKKGPKIKHIKKGQKGHYVILHTLARWYNWNNVLHIDTPFKLYHLGIDTSLHIPPTLSLESELRWRIIIINLIHNDDPSFQSSSLSRCTRGAGPGETFIW